MINIRSNKFLFKSISGVIFDKDGTITDSHIYWSKIIRMRTKAILKKFSIDNIHADDISASMGLNTKNNKLFAEGPIALKSRKDVINNVLIYLKKFNKNIEFYDIEYLFIEVHNQFSEIVSEFIDPIIPCINLIKELYANNIKLSLITSDTTSNAELVCDKLNIKSYFDFIVGSDQTANKKETGLIAIKVCEMMNLDSNQVICIGDTISDYKMSINANLKGSILVESGQVPIKELLKNTKNCVSCLSEIEIEKFSE